MRQLEVLGVKQIENKAPALPESRRAGLILRSLQTLAPSDFDVSDEDVFQRDKDLDTGPVEAISHEELFAALRRHTAALIDRLAPEQSDSTTLIPN